MNRSPMTPAELAELAADLALLDPLIATHGEAILEVGRFPPIQTVETLLGLLATIEEVRADGASSHSRYLVADADLRHQGAQESKLFRRMADATRERDAALATMDSIADALDAQGVPTTLPPEEEGDDTITLTTPRRVLWVAGQWDQQKAIIRQVVAELAELREAEEDRKIADRSTAPPRRAS